MNSDVLRRFESFLATQELPSLGPQTRASRKSLSELTTSLEAAFVETEIASEKQALIRSLVLLWHDHLDESHSLSQEIHTADGSFLHGIMHRREPDYSNAKYWFNRVGVHPTYPVIAERSTALLKTHPSLLQELVRNGQWDPNAFVDACERVARSDRDLVPLLQKVQEIESRVLLEHFCQGAK